MIQKEKCQNKIAINTIEFIKAFFKLNNLTQNVLIIDLFEEGPWYVWLFQSHKSSEKIAFSDVANSL